MSAPVAGTGLTRTLDAYAAHEGVTSSIALIMGGGYMVSLGAVHADGDTLTEAIEKALRESGVNPCAVCGWESTCGESCHS